MLEIHPANGEVLGLYLRSLDCHRPPYVAHSGQDSNFEEQSISVRFIQLKFSDLNILLLTASVLKLVYHIHRMH